ncbi:tagaturonate reductase [Lichenicoccus sp.]|uniref:tagaturonate reductase n=1 Tax=Lichenicoccus sp. TaxID=2781899 RepID=UPI003D123F2A
MSTLPVLRRTQPRRPVRILQIGGGNFLRGFFDWMVDVANEKGLTDSGIAIMQTVGGGLPEALAAQDMLYTVLVRGLQDGREIDERRIVSSVSDAFSAADGWNRALAYAADPALEIIVSNTTESGIVDVEEPPPGATAPASFPAKLTALLAARHALGGGAGLLVLPCELIPRQGRTLKRIVAGHARRWQFGDDFLAWLERDVAFVDTLVDRIVPGYPSRDIEALQAAWGIRDPLAVAVEPFHLLVVEAPAELEHRLPLRQAGLNVVWTDDLEPYRVRKVRILNGAHSATALAAFLAGLDTVKSIIDDPQFAAFLRRVLDDEIVPFLPLDEAECRSYAQSVLERFANPYLQHDLLAISLNSTSKWRIRILPSLKAALAAHGTLPGGLVFSLAALIRFIRGGPDEAGRNFPVRDDRAAIEAITAAWRRHGSDMVTLVRDVFASRAIWGEDLNAIAGLAERTARDLALIERAGVRQALAAL